MNLSWNIGVMEYWNNGVLVSFFVKSKKKSLRISVALCVYSESSCVTDFLKSYTEFHREVMDVNKVFGCNNGMLE